MKKNEYERLRNEMLREAAISELEYSRDENRDTEEHIKLFKAYDESLSTGNKDKHMSLKDAAGMCIEVAKVFVPVAAYFAASRFWAGFEQTGTVRTTGARALEGHKIRFF